MQTSAPAGEIDAAFLAIYRIHKINKSFSILRNAYSHETGGEGGRGGAPTETESGRPLLWGATKSFFSHFLLLLHSGRNVKPLIHSLHMSTCGHSFGANQVISIDAFVMCVGRRIFHVFTLTLRHQFRNIHTEEKRAT